MNIFTYTEVARATRWLSSSHNAVCLLGKKKAPLADVGEQTTCKMQWNCIRRAMFVPPSNRDETHVIIWRLLSSPSIVCDAPLNSVYSRRLLLASFKFRRWIHTNRTARYMRVMKKKKKNRCGFGMKPTRRQCTSFKSIFLSLSLFLVFQRYLIIYNHVATLFRLDWLMLSSFLMKRSGEGEIPDPGQIKTYYNRWFYRQTLLLCVPLSLSLSLWTHERNTQSVRTMCNMHRAYLCIVHRASYTHRLCSNSRGCHFTSVFARHNKGFILPMHLPLQTEWNKHQYSSLSRYTHFFLFHVCVCVCVPTSDAECNNNNEKIEMPAGTNMHKHQHSKACINIMNIMRVCGSVHA